MKHPKKIQTGCMGGCRKTYDVKVEEITEPGSCGEPEYLYHLYGALDNRVLTSSELDKGIADFDIKVIRQYEY